MVQAQNAQTAGMQTQPAHTTSPEQTTSPQKAFKTSVGNLEDIYQELDAFANRGLGVQNWPGLIGRFRMNLDQLTRLEQDIGWPTVSGGGST